MPKAAILAAGLHLLDPFRNLEIQTTAKPAEAFSNAPDDPVCGWSKPEMPVDGWLPQAQRQAFHPQTWVGIVGISWWGTEGVHHIETAAMPCIAYRLSVTLSWPYLH